MKTGEESLVNDFLSPEQLWNKTFAEQNNWREQWEVHVTREQPRYISGRRGCVAKVVNIDVSSGLMCSDPIARWSWKAETVSSHCIRVSLEGDNR